MLQSLQEIRPSENCVIDWSLSLRILGCLLKSHQVWVVKFSGQEITWSAQWELLLSSSTCGVTAGIFLSRVFFRVVMGHAAEPAGTLTPASMAGVADLLEADISVLSVEVTSCLQLLNDQMYTYSYTYTLLLPTFLRHQVCLCSFFRDTTLHGKLHIQCFTKAQGSFHFSLPCPASSLICL